MEGRGSSPSDGMGSAFHPVPANSENTVWRKGVMLGGHIAVIFCTRAESVSTSKTSATSRKIGEVL